jgi:rhodanese-related sulfurtransferase
MDAGTTDRFVEDAKTHRRQISIEELHERQGTGEGRYEIVDVRDDDAWRAGHIPGARHLAKDVLERDVDRAIPDRGGEVVLYCDGGAQSTLAAATLLRMGYVGAVALIGGFQEWVARGGEVEK